MPNALQQAGALSEPSNFAPLHTNRIFTGLWTNRSFLRDAATSVYEEKYGMGRQDSILAGYNSEISPRLTLYRRPGSSVFNSNLIPPVNRFYSFNTFNLVDEFIRVMADTGSDVRDVTVEKDGTNTNRVIWIKSAGARSTYFLGVGNTLYFTNGVDNKQVAYNPTTGTWGTVEDWRIDAPVNAPTVSKGVVYIGSWQANMVFSRTNTAAKVLIVDDNGNIQNCTTFGTTGNNPPTSWNPNKYQSTTDGSVIWQNVGTGAWVANNAQQFGDFIYRTASDGKQYFYEAQGVGTTGSTQPSPWNPAITSITADGSVNWLNLGQTMIRAQGVGDSQLIIATDTIQDSSGTVQACLQAGKTGATPPIFGQTKGLLTYDPTGQNAQGSVVWQSQGAQGSVQYGYEYMDSASSDLSNMSPASSVILASDGEAVQVAGDGSASPKVDTVVIFRTAHGGSTFLYAGQVPNPGGGQKWVFNDTVLDADLNAEWQAQVSGEGTPLPAGATCLGYHLGRIFAAVGNVVYISSGPDAIVGGSSGNAGFDTTFTAQSKITRFWTCSLGMVVFTVRDAYIILGAATDSDPLYMVVFIENLPLRSYDCFTVNKTTPYLLLGNNMLVALDPSAGITEVGFPIADLLETEYDSAASYVTWHSQYSRDTALYVANGTDHWYRMAANNAPETGSSWSTRANFASLGCVQSVEISPGQYRLLISGAGTASGPVLQRDRTLHNDNGVLYDAQTCFGAIVLAQPGQLAALFFITLESVRLGTRPTLALLLGEHDGTFEALNRTRQDPPDLPPSNTIYSDRYHFAQNQKAAWCRHFQMLVSWPAEDAQNELLTYTIFGQTWQEMRAQ